MNERQLHEFTPRLAELGVKLIEQPLSVEGDDVLIGFDSPVPLCADESCQTTEPLPSLMGKYQYNWSILMDRCRPHPTS